MIKMNENMLKKIVIDTIKGEQHLGENLKNLCVDYIEQLQKQHADLNEHYNNMFECHCNRVQVEQLQNNWNELKKGLQSLFEFDEGVVSKDYLECAEDTLEKMQELENKNDK